MDRMQSIELALKNETTEMEYYLHEARRSQNDVAREMFETLAADEREHMTRIRGLHERLLSSGAWPRDVRIEVRGTNVKDVLDGLVRKVGAAARCEGDDVEALERAAKFEASGTKFYTVLSGECDNPMERTFFAFLASIEREHLQSIERALDFFRDPAAYMLEHGKAGLDGA